MDKLIQGENKIKKSAEQFKKMKVDNIKEEVKENYKIGIEYYKNINESENKN